MEKHVGCARGRAQHEFCYECGNAEAKVTGEDPTGDALYFIFGYFMKT